MRERPDLTRVVGEVRRQMAGSMTKRRPVYRSETSAESADGDKYHDVLDMNPTISLPPWNFYHSRPQATCARPGSARAF